MRTPRVLHCAGILLLVIPWTQAICPGSPWQEWRGYCYRLTHQSVPWHGLRGDCKVFFRSAEPASVASKAENDFIQKNLAKGQPVWLGMRSVNNILSWVDGSAVNYRNFPSSRTQTAGAQDVVQMDSSGRWRFAESHTAPAQRGVCKMKSCECPSGWRLWDRRCYRAVSRRLSWTEARQHCRRLDPTADLVSIINQRENDFTFNLMKQYPFWIGLNDRETGDTFTWSNGDPHPYRNWHPPTEPNGRPNSADCVQMLQDKTWADTGCLAASSSLKLPFVCELIVCQRDKQLQRQNVRGSQIRLYQTDASARCPPGWTLSDDRCYLAAPSSGTFQGVQQQCQQLHPRAQIALLRSVHDNDRVFFEARSLPMWVDYGSRSGRAATTATERLSSPTFTYWEPDVRAARSVNSDCAGMQSTSQWQPQRCDRDQLPGLCELPVCDPACQPGWRSWRGFCYRRIRPRRTRALQAAACQRTGGTLASIHSQEENDFIATLAFPSTGDYSERESRILWIGAARPDSATPWRWSDCSPWTMARWQGSSDLHNTKYTNTTCAALLLNGRWKDNVFCESEEFSAVCKMDPCAEQFGPVAKSGCRTGKEKEPLTEGGQTPNPQTKPVAKPEEPIFICPPDWRLHNQYCYLGVTTPNTFLNALQTCTDTYIPSHVASLHSDQDTQLLLELTGGGPAWIGLTAAYDFPRWLWMDGSDPEVGYTGWAPGQPDGDFQNMRLCAAVNKKGTWLTQNCLSSQLSFACRLPAVGVQSEPRCPDPARWREEENGDCYLFHREGATFAAAASACGSDGGADFSARLPVIGSPRQERALQRLANGHVVRLGLTNDWPDGSWRWQDGSPTLFTNWLSGAPPAPGQGVLCASLDSRQRGWVAQSCTDSVPFYCQAVIEESAAAP